MSDMYYDLGYTYSHDLAEAVRDAGMTLCLEDGVTALEGSIAQLGHAMALLATTNGGDETTLVEMLMGRLDAVEGDFPDRWHFNLTDVTLDAEVLEDVKRGE